MVCQALLRMGGGTEPETVFFQSVAILFAELDRGLRALGSLRGGVESGCWGPCVKREGYGKRGRITPYPWINGEMEKHSEGRDEKD